MLPARSSWSRYDPATANVRRPREQRLQLRVELLHLHHVGGVDLVLGQVLAGLEAEDIQAARDLGAVDEAVVPVGGPVAAREHLFLAQRAAVEERDLDRVGAVGEVEHRQAALVPRLHHDVAAGHRDDGAVVGHAVLQLALRHRQLVVARQLHLPVDDVEDGVRAPVGRVRRAAAGLAASAPLVGEEDLAAVVVEGGRVPVGEVGVYHFVQAHRVHRVRDVQQDAVPRARARGQADLRKDRDVVALVGEPGFLGALAVVAALPESAELPRLRVREQARHADDAGLFRVRERHLDHLDAEVGGVGILLRGQPRATGQFVARTHARRPGDVDVLVVVRIGHHRMGMGAAAGLHCGHLPGRLQIRHVEDAHAAEALHAHAVLDALGAAVEPAAGLLRGHEQEIAVDRHVPLSTRTYHRHMQLDVAGVGDVVDLEAVVVALEEVIPLEGEIRVREPGALARRLRVEEPFGPGRGRDELQVPDRALGVHPPRGQVHPRVEHVPVEGGTGGLGQRVGAHFGELCGSRLSGRNGLGRRVRRQRQRHQHGTRHHGPQRHPRSIHLKPLPHRTCSPVPIPPRPPRSDGGDHVSCRSPGARACAESPSPGPPPPRRRSGKSRIPVRRPDSRTIPRPSPGRRRDGES